MTVSSSVNKVIYSGNSATTVFPVSYYFLANSHLLVILRSSTGVETVQTLTTNYTVTGAGNPAGGSITMLIAPPTGTTLTIARNVPATQETDYLANDPFPAESHERALDKLTMLVQENEEIGNRSIQIPISDSSSINLTLPASNNRAGKYLGFDASGNAIVQGVIPDVIYYGALSANPATRPNGTASLVGDLYFNTSVNQMRAYSGSVWIDYEADAVAAKVAAELAETNAESARDAAQLAETNAELAEVNAELAEVNAEAAQVGAEAARDAAVLGAPTVYVDTTAGLAGTTNGQYFSVPSAVNSEYLILYRNVAGVATQIKIYPAKSALDPLQRSSQAIFAVEDVDGNLGLNIQSGFEVDLSGSVETIASLQSNKIKKWSWGVSDNDGNVVIGVDDQGRLVADFELVPGAISYKTGGTYDYEVNHVFTYGQSLSVGQATPAISTTQNYDNVMFTRGMRPQYDYPLESAAQWYAAFVPAIEAQSPTNALLAETPSMGTGDMIKERITVEDGLVYSTMKYQIALSAPGFGATTILQLSKSGSHYTRMMDQATYGLSLSNAANKTYAVQAVTWTQGESDYISSTTRATYLTRLNTLVADFNTDLKVITGQTKDIPLISYQIASHKVYAGGSAQPTIALAQLDAEAANPLVYIATPMYHFTYAGASDGHLTNISSRWLGAYYGLAYKRIVIDGEDWKPLKPLSSLKQSNVLVVTFHVPYGRLEFDTSDVALNTNYGFELVDSGGSALTISSVAIMGPDTVKVVAAASIPAGAKLRYAWTGSGDVGSTNGPRGNLRDTQGNDIVFNPTGINKPMHNWCVIFEIGV